MNSFQAAFLLPILNMIFADPGELTNGFPCKPKAVVIAPTRELAIQIEEQARLLTAGSVIRTGVVYGGVAPFANRGMLAVSNKPKQRVVEFLIRYWPIVHSCFDYYCRKGYICSLPLREGSTCSWTATLSCLMRPSSSFLMRLTGCWIWDSNLTLKR